MALSINRQIFHTKIFPNIKFDENIGKYKINLTDYITLNLTKRQIGILERICIKNDIVLEKAPELISTKETDELFKRLNALKEEKEKCSNISELNRIDEEIFKIRTTIFEGHQQLIYKIIVLNIPNLDNSPNKEDIIQSGYESLIKAIDNYDVERMKSNTFRWFLYNYTSTRILRIAKYINNNNYTNNDLSKLEKIKKKYQEVGIEPTIYELSIESGFEEERIKELQVLEQLSNADSIERIIETEEINNEYITGIEEEIYQDILKELLMLIIDTLPNEHQRQILTLCYGLDGESAKSYSQVGEMLGMSRQSVDQIKISALNNLKNPIRAKYIKELTIGYTQIEIPQTSDIIPLDINSSLYEKLEIYLIQYMNKEELISLIMELKPKYQDVLLSHFNLHETSNLEYYDKMKSLSISPTTYIARKKVGLNELRRLIKEKYIKNQTNEEIQDVLDYLMYNYLHKAKSTTKKRIKK